MTVAASLTDFSGGYFIKLAKEAGDKCVALLVDEVGDTTAVIWDVLLKEKKPKNLLVLGVGVPRLNYSPQFDKNNPELNKPVPMFLTDDDLPEITAYFEKKGYDSQVVEEVCKKLLLYTSGHVYPFVVIANYIFNPANNVDLSAVDGFLTSKKFRSSEEMRLVRQRCFSFIMGYHIYEAVSILLRKSRHEDEAALEKLGLFSFGSFLSPLLVSEIFLEMPVNYGVEVMKLTSDHSPEKIPYVQQVISAGLRDMKEDDFQDSRFSGKVHVETAVGFSWGYNVHSVLPEVLITPQVRLQSDEPKPLLEYRVNGSFELGIKLALNLNEDEIREHLQRFDEGYKPLKENGYVLHFETERIEPTVNMKPPYDTLHAQNRVYTFVKRKNALYRGSTMVQKGVARYISVPYPKRTFSTSAVSRTMVKALKLM